MIRRALEGYIKGDFEPMIGRFGQKPSKVLQSSQFGVNGFMAAFRRSDGPRTSDITRPGRQGIVFAFTECSSNRMNRRKVEDVETHRGNVGQPLFAIPKGSMTLLFVRARPGEDLVPCGEARFLAIDDNRQLFVIPGDKLTLGVKLN